MNHGRGEALGVAVPYPLTRLVQGAFLTQDLNHLIYPECFTSVLLYPLCTVSHLDLYLFAQMASRGDDDRKGKRKMTKPQDKQMPHHGRDRTTGGSSSAAGRVVARDGGRRDQMIQDEENLERVGVTPLVLQHCLATKLRTKRDQPIKFSGFKNLKLI